MRRREVITGMASTLAWPLSARAQHREKVARIGYLAAGTHDNLFVRQNINALLRGLRDLGHVEGQNIVIEYRFADGGLTGCPTSLWSWSG